MADRMIFHKTALTGGGADALDNISAAARGDFSDPPTNTVPIPLQDNDVAIVHASAKFSSYLYDADSTALESSPDVIRPDDVAALDPGRWILQGVSVSEADIAALITGAGAITEPLDADEFPFYKIVGTLLKKVTWANIKATLKTYFDGLYALTGHNHTGTYEPAAADFTSKVSAASEGAAGKVELATDAETVTGTATDRAITPANLTAHLASPKPVGETAPNSIRGKNKEIFKTETGTLTAAECAGTIVSNYGMTDADCIIDLPTAAEGLAFVCILPAVRARYFRLRCPSAQSDKIYLLGVAGSDDGYVGVASGYATGSAISMFTFKASDGGYDWFAIPIFGTWVAG